MAVYFTSDLHFGHANIINFDRRPFHNVDNMNKLLVMNYNEVVQPDDTCFFLGDIAMGDRTQTIPLCKELNGHKILIEGNHDKTFHAWGEQLKYWKDQYEDAGFTFWDPQNSWIHARGRDIQLCHFPFVGDTQHDIRFGHDRPKDVGQWLIHGHVHTMWKRNAKQVNIGAPVWNYVPVSLERVLDLMDEPEYLWPNLDPEF